MKTFLRTRMSGAFKTITLLIFVLLFSLKSSALEGSNKPAYLNHGKNNGSVSPSLSKSKDLIKEPATSTLGSVNLVDNILYVDKNVVGGNGSGDSWANAYRELSDALSWARQNASKWTSGNPLKIWVKAGLYKPTYASGNRAATFDLLKNVEIYGGFSHTDNHFAARNPQKNLTVLSGYVGSDNSHVDANGIVIDPINLNEQNSVTNVVRISGGDPTIKLDGFTITGAYNTEGYGYGGGLNFKGGSISLSNLVFIANRASFGGGVGMESASNSELKLQNCKFIRNLANSSGGGLLAFKSDIENCDFVENRTLKEEGGAIFFSFGGAKVSNCKFIRNNSYFRGAIFLWGNEVSINNSLFENNVARGGLSRDIAQNFWIGQTSFSRLNIENNTFIYSGTDPINVSPDAPLDYVKISNNIFSGGGFNSVGSFTLENNIFSGDCSSCNSNPSINNLFNVNPNFTDPENGNYTLEPCSPAINSGKNSLYNGGNIDLGGNARISTYNPNIDIGAYEYGDRPTSYPDMVLEDKTVTYNSFSQGILARNIHSSVAVVYEITGEDNQTKPGFLAIDAGVYTITAFIPSCKIRKTAKLTINRATAVISANEEQQHVYNGTVKNVGASLNHSETPLTYLPKQGYSDVGTYEITVSAPKTKNYEAATRKVNLLIEKGTFEGITFVDKAFTYSGQPHALAISGEPEGTSVTYTGNNKTDVGTYTVTALVSQPNYHDVTLSATLTITKADALITADEEQKHTTDGTVKNVVATLSHTETALTYSPKQGYSEAGTYEITVSAAETENYNAGSKKVSLIIENKTFEGVFIENKQVAYNGQPHSILVIGASADATVSYTGNSKTDAGVYMVTALVTQPNYNDITLTATLTILKAESVISADEEQKHVYNGTVQNVTASLNHAEAELSYSPQRGYTTVGSYPIVVSVSETNNYKAATKTVNLIIENKTFEGLVFANKEVTYNGQSHFIALTGYPAHASFRYTGNNKTEAGVYTVTVLVTQPNYNDITLTATLTILKAESIITADEEQKHTADGTVKDVVASLNHSETTLTYSPKQGYSGAGTYEITISAAQTQNYKAADKTVNLIIENKTFEGLAFANKEVSYNGQRQSILVTGASDAATITYTGNDKTDAGVYTVTALITQPNYDDVTLTATLTILKADAVITSAMEQKHTADGTVKDVVASLNHSETALTYSPKQGYSGAGTYEITIAAAETQNYKAANKTVNLVIENKTFEGLAFDNKQVTYNGQPQSIFITGTSDDATITYSENGKTDAGTYTITALVTKPNYNDVTLTATLTILKADGVITAVAEQKHTADGSMKNIVASLNHSETTLTYSPKQGYSEAGSYEITISTTETTNYKAVSKTVNLVIENKTFEGLSFINKQVIYNGQQHYIHVTGASDAATITYTGNDKTDAGTYTVTALVTQPNYDNITLTATLTILKAESVISADEEQKHVYNGTVQNVTASLNHTETELIYSPKIGYAAVGFYPIIVSAAETKNYKAASKTVNLIIENKTFEGLAFANKEVSYNGQPQSILVTGVSDAATITYTGNGKTDAGVYTVTALVTQPNYNDITLTATLTILKADAEITAISEQKHTADGSMKSVVASLNHSETTLSYSPKQDYAEAGTYEITVSAVETKNYKAANKKVSLIIENKTFEGLVFVNKEVTFNGQPQSIFITGASDKATISYSGNGKADAGTYTVTALVTQPNYDDVTLTATLTILKADAVITSATEQKHKADGTVKNIVASLNHSETILSYSPKQGYTEAGTYEITVSAIETKNYKAANKKISLIIENKTFEGLVFVNKEVTFNGQPQSIFIMGASEGATITYSGNGKADAGTYTVTALVTQPNYDDITLTATLTILKAGAVITSATEQKHKADGTVKNIVASLNHSETILSYSPKQGYAETGTYEIIVSAIETKNYKAATKTVKLIIENKTFEGLLFDNKQVTYNGQPHSIFVTGASADVTISYTGNSKADAGIYAVTAVVSQPNYNDVTLTATLTIKKADAVITANSLQKYTADGTVKNVVATLNHGEAALTYSPKQGYAETGTYEITISATETKNYKAATKTINLVIENKIFEGLAFANRQVTYTGQPQSILVTGASNDATITYTGNDKTDAGTYTVTALITQPNYDDVKLTAILTILKADAIITANSVQSHTADGSVKNVIASLNHTESLLSYSPQKGFSAPGTYTITVSAPESKNYKKVSRTVTLSIGKASFDGVNFNNGVFTYNGQPHSIYVSGLPDGATVSYTENGQVNAGNYAVKALIQKPNYNDLYLEATITISKATSVIWASGEQKHVYDGSVKNVEASLNHGESQLYFSPQRGYINAGSYKVTVTVPESHNYYGSSMDVYLLIDKATFTNAVFQGKEVVYNGEPHYVSVIGIPEGTRVTYSRNGQSNAGNYTVSALIQRENYYDLWMETRLVIHKAPQEIAFDEIAPKHLENDEDFALNAKASSHLSVEYTYTFEAEEAPATVSAEGWVSLKTSGEVLITVHQKGNENYLPAASQTRVLEISSSDATIHWITVGDLKYETPDEEIYYVIDCDSNSDSVSVVMRTEVGAKVTPARSFVLSTPKPGIYRQTVTIQSQDYTNTLSYQIVIEKKFRSEDIIVQKFNNVFLANNNKNTNGGYNFIAYEWFRDGLSVGSGQYYSAGDQVSDNLGSGTYYVKMQTENGTWLSTCDFQTNTTTNFESSALKIFPNPIVNGNTLKVEVDLPKEELQSMKIQVFTTAGEWIMEKQSDQTLTEIILPGGLAAGSYVIKCTSTNYTKSARFSIY